ncbi:uncharacterized protein BKA78DRAFT_298794 [Phyllosticta capitalensis]|uniref:uncharacterized protein n=1 Tax=Phyllosticta capitalensis TaxID=121624 RepID=UPI0031310E42
MANTLTHNKRKSGIHMQLSLIIVNPLGLGPKESSRIEWVWRYATVRGHNAICVYGELSQYNNDTPGYETTTAIMKTATSTLANAKSDRSLIGESRTSPKHNVFLQVPLEDDGHSLDISCRDRDDLENISARLRDLIDHERSLKAPTQDCDRFLAPVCWIMATPCRFTSTPQHLSKASVEDYDCSLTASVEAYTRSVTFTLEGHDDSLQLHFKAATDLSKSVDHEESLKAPNRAPCASHCSVRVLHLALVSFPLDVDRPSVFPAGSIVDTTSNFDQCSTYPQAPRSYPLAYRRFARNNFEKGLIAPLVCL